MIAVALAAVADVQSRIPRDLTVAETAWATVLLEDAEDLILGRIPDLLDRINAVPPTIRRSAVERAEVWAVVRVIRNPDGRSQESISGEYSFSRDAALASGALYIAVSDWGDLLRSATQRRFSSVRLVTNGEI